MWEKFPRWSCSTKPQKYPTRVLPRPTTKYGEISKVKIGPNALGGSENKLNARYWICYQEEGFVYIRGAINDLLWSSPTLIFEEPEPIVSLDFSFDQLGREVIFYQKGSELRLWFFDSSTEPFQFVNVLLVENGSYPNIAFDIIYNPTNPLSDVILCYVKNDTIYKRLQRDRFAIEYSSGVKRPGIKIESAGMSVNNKFQIVYVYPDLRDGALSDKVYETTSSVFGQIQSNNIEIGFTIELAPSDCELRKKGQAYFTVLSNFGVINLASVSPSNNEQSLLVRFQYMANTGTILVQILRDPYFEIGTGFTGEYYSEEFTDFRFDAGTYILRFTQVVEALPILQKRLELIKNGVTIIDEIVSDIRSRDGGFESPSAINKLRFGSYANSAFPSTIRYIYPYSAQYLNMYSIVNGVRTDWPLESGVSGIESEPPGNPMVLKFKDSNNPEWSFVKGIESPEPET